MRQSFHNYDFLTLNDKFIGLSLGYDFCAEHEWGFKGIKSGLGIPTLTRENIGIKARMVTKSPMDDFQLKEDGDLTYLVYRYRASYGDKVFSEQPLWSCGFQFKDFTKTDINTSWSEDGFGIVGSGEQARERLKDIYDNFVNQNIAITYIGTGNPFANNSLSILIVDRLPEEITKQMEEADTQHLDLQDIIDKLDLEGKARENGMDWNHFHAISPNRIDHNTPAELEKAKTKYGTKHDVIVWVNGASDQGYGWFTVEDVLEWISHKGTKPISDWDESKKKVKE